MKKKESCYVCDKEKSKRPKPAQFFFLATNDYEFGDPLFHANNPPDYTDPKKAVACCNEHVEDLKDIFRDEMIREVPYEEWVVIGKAIRLYRERNRTC